MSQPAALGLVLGALIGAGYVALQRVDLRRRQGNAALRGVGSLACAAAFRLLFLVVAWWLAFRFTEADKYWLTGALAVTYSLPLLWHVKRMLPKNDESR